MSLVFAAISPHPPLLIPAIGKENIKKVEKTKKALEEMEEDLYLSHPDIILVVSPHGSLFQESFTLNVSPEYVTDLREFGDIATKLKFKGELPLAAQIYDTAKREHLPLTSVNERIIDHGTAVPLFYLARHLPRVRLLVAGFSGLDRKTHLDFGILIKEQIMKTNNRVAVIASGDLSHALTNDAPAPFHPAGVEFDNKIQELLSTNNTAGLLRLDEKLLNDAAECGFRSLLILMGILKGVNYTYKLYSYEAPFGVGYLSANFIL